MKMKMGLKLSQQLRMTPQLQQAIKLLQLSRLELENLVQQEMQENPILEEVQESLDEESFEAKEKINDTDVKENAEMQDPQKQDEFEWENYVEESPMPGQMTNFAGGANEEINNYENVFSSPQTLYDHLMWQLSLSGFNEEEKELGAILIGYIEDDGYLKTPIAQIAEDEEVDAIELEEMVPFLQEFDPPGVFARDLKECLLIQAKHLEEDTHELVEMIENHLTNLEKKNYPAIAKDMNIDLEVVVELSKIIYTMEPKPGRSFITNETHYVTPDVYVYPVGEEYVVSLNEDGLRRL